jgi:hypothetical protein
MRHIPALILTVCLLSGSAGTAWGAHSLFGDFVWGTPKNELAKHPGAAPGEGAFADDLLLPEAFFAGLPWTVRLEFDKDRLVRVSLIERYSRERMEAVTRQFTKDRYEMLSVLIDTTFLDLVKTLKIRGPEEVREEWKRFVQGKNPERMVYAWFDTSAMSADMKTMAGDLPQLLAMGPAEILEAEVTLLRDSAGSEPAMLLVGFSLPAMR